MKDRLKAHITDLPEGTEVHIYTLDVFTEGIVDKRKYVGHLLYRFCTEDKLLVKDGSLDRAGKTIAVYKRAGEDTEVIEGHPLSHYWKGPAP